MTELKNTHTHTHTTREQALHLPDLPARPGLVITNRNVQVYMKREASTEPSDAHSIMPTTCQGWSFRH